MSSLKLTFYFINPDIWVTGSLTKPIFLMFMQSIDTAAAILSTG